MLALLFSAPRLLFPLDLFRPYGSVKLILPDRALISSLSTKAFPSTDQVSSSLIRPTSSVRL